MDDQRIATCEDIRRMFLGTHQEQDSRLNWMVITAAGICPDDSMFIKGEQRAFERIMDEYGLNRCMKAREATLSVMVRPSESEIQIHINRMPLRTRLIVYNDMDDVEWMADRNFDTSTACIFDHDSNKAVRLYDSPKGRSKGSTEPYLQIELSEINDTTVAVHASRIAAMRLG